MFYFRDKTSKLDAYKALIKYHIEKLPVTLDLERVNIKIFTLQYLARYHHESIDRYLRISEYRGFIAYQTEYDRYVAFLNAEDPEPLLRWVLSMAIGYIESGQKNANEALFFAFSDQYIEDFAYTFTCPDCVLEKHKILSENDIVKICKIPLPYALEKRKRLILSNKHKSRLEAKLEEILNSLFVVK